jgi:hypothetical protein
MRLPFAAFFQHRALLLVSMQATIVDMFDVNGKWVNWEKMRKVWNRFEHVGAS